VIFFYPWTLSFYGSFIIDASMFIDIQIKDYYLSEINIQKPQIVDEKKYLFFLIKKRVVNILRNCFFTNFYVCFDICHLLTE